VSTTIHIVIETPGANAFQILKDATEDDSPTPKFIFPPVSTIEPENGLSWKWTTERPKMIFPSIESENPNECFLFISHNLDLADQFEEISHTFKKNSDFSIGKVLFLIYSPILLSPPADFQEWIDASAHFADAMLFTERNNENAAVIKLQQDRYSTLRYPMESIVLGKKNNPWARILETCPRRISHIFDSPELLDTEDQPEMDRYLLRLPSGQRKQKIPLIFDKS
jgi:hypothetical protein